MSVLVTGGAGYIGSFTVEALQQRGERGVVLDNLSAGHREALDPSVPLIVGELGDEDLLRRVMREHHVERVIHFAAFASVPESVARPEIYFKNNVANTLVLLEAMRQEQVQHIVFSSTAATYGEPTEIPIPENHPKNPVNPYGLTKLIVEQMLEAYGAAHGLRHVALRYFNACGGSPNRGEDHTPETHIIPLVLQTALGQRESFSIFGDDFPTPDGTCIRDYIHVEDLATAHLAALDHLAKGGASEKINLGNGQGYSVREVVEAARAVTGREIKVLIAGRRPGDPAVLIASAQKAHAVLNWSPRIPELRAIIASAWAWHTSHPRGYAGVN